MQVGEITFANVHLSHGQLLNRRQLARIAAALRGKPSAIIGDYNIVGPVILPGFPDVGPRELTHFASNVVPFRLDRCLVHGLACRTADALAFGPSDHRPIRLELAFAEGWGLEAACGRGRSTAGSGATGWGGCIGDAARITSPVLRGRPGGGRLSKAAANFRSEIFEISSAALPSLPCPV